MRPRRLQEIGKWRCPRILLGGVHENPDDQERSQAAVGDLRQGHWRAGEPTQRVIDAVRVEHVETEHYVEVAVKGSARHRFPLEGRGRESQEFTIADADYTLERRG